MKPPERQAWRKTHPIAFTTVAVAVGSCFAAVTGWWTIEDHWQTKAEATEHAHKDEARAAWTQYGFADVRAQFLSDHVFECTTKRAIAPKLNPLDVATCTRYEDEYKRAKDAADQLKKAALDSGRDGK